MLAVGSSVRIKAAGDVADISASNGHAFKVAGKWYSADELEAASGSGASVDKPVLQIIPGKTLESVSAGGEDVDVLVRVQTPAGSAAAQTPTDIVCVLDISGSMGSEATIQSSEGSGGLSLLDVAKHGVKTLLNTLGPKDRVAVVLFDHGAEVLFELTAMDEEGLRTTQEKLDAVRQRGATNIWRGLEKGLEVCKEGQDAKDSDTKRLAHLILLTDGQTTDRDRVIPNLLDFKAKHEGLPCTVSTFGFGYNIDSPLLVDMASQGHGVYAFIPDAGFVGTIFVNLVSNLLVTMAQDATLVVTPEEDAEIQGVYGGLKTADAGSGSKRIELGMLQFGQTKDVVLKMSVKQSKEAYLSAQVTYALPGGHKDETEFVEATLPGKADEVKEVAPQRCRSKFTETIEKAMQVPDSSFAEKASLMSDLADEIEKCNIQEQYAVDLLTDVKGEGTAAVSERDAYGKWGRHYLPSLMFAHRLQICNNFKDPGVQHYGGEMFKDLQDAADEKFNTLPAPTPTRPPSYGGYGGYGGGGGSVARAPVSMAAYNDRCGG